MFSWSKFIIKQNPTEVFKLATELDNFNKERKLLEADLTKDIKKFK